MSKKKKKVAEISDIQTTINENDNAQTRLEICKECENFIKSVKVCHKLDCEKCKGSIITYLSTVKNHCPIEKW
jgi:hypothetical protein